MRFAGVKILFRVLKRHPVYTLMNIVGLAVGMASFILISLYVREELRFDRFHEHADRIVRVTSSYSDQTGTRSFARTYPAIAPALLADFPEVREATRLQQWKAPMRSGSRQFNEQELFMVDPTFFRVFSFPLVRGDAAHALESRNSVVVTRSAARRYFGDDDPIGRELVMADTVRLQVTGLVEDPPPYSHIQFSMLLPMQIVRDRWARRGNDIDATWTAGTFYTYLLLTGTEARDALQPRLHAFLDRYMDDRDESGVTFEIGLQRLTTIHLKSHLRQELGPNGSETYVAAFLLIAILVLLISCVNFINLATARASRRMREVGVRKALGAPRLQIARQFLGEAFLMSFAALFVALFIVDRLLPWFNELAGSFISPASEVQPSHVVGLLALTVAVGFFAGGYPAIVLSSFRPSHVLRSAAGGTTRTIVPGVRRGLVATQFFLSVSIMACTAIAWQQTVYMRSAEPGFDTRVLVLPYYWDSSVTAQFPTLKHELRRLSDVENVTASGDVPGRMFTSMSYWIEGMAEGERGGTNALIVDPDFAETYGLEVVAGRDFSPDQTAHLDASFVLNEAAVQELGLTPDEVIGKTFEMNTRGPVIGVVKNFHFEGLQKPLEPLVMTVWPDWFGYVSISLHTSDYQKAVSGVENVWSSLLPNRPFEYFFLDQDFERQYRAEERFSEVFGVFSILAIFISCLGLLGLAAFTAERKTKEIGIRKVFGASVARIVAHVNREFALLLIVGGAASIPATWFVMNGWLQSFAYRIEMGPLPFVVSVAAVALLGLLTVSYHSIRAATANPIDSLRYE